MFTIYIFQNFQMLLWTNKAKSYWLGNRICLSKKDESYKTVVKEYIHPMSQVVSSCFRRYLDASYISILYVDKLFSYFSFYLYCVVFSLLRFTVWLFRRVEIFIKNMFYTWNIILTTYTIPTICQISQSRIAE